MTQDHAPDLPITVHRLATGMANVYLLRGSRDVLIDTATPGAEARISHWLERLGVTPQRLSLILLTHAHRDHVGAAAALRERFDTPIALARAGVAAARSGQDAFGRPTGMMGKVITRAFPRGFTPFEPDVPLDDGMTLEDFGVGAMLVATPGHTDHCMTVLTRGGDALVGDLLTGHHLLRDRPGLPYLMAAEADWSRSVTRLQESRVERVHPGHGRSFGVRRLRSLMDRVGAAARWATPGGAHRTDARLVRGVEGRASEAAPHAKRQGLIAAGE